MSTRPRLTGGIKSYRAFGTRADFLQGFAAFVLLITPISAGERSIIGGEVEIMTFELKGRGPGGAPTANLLGVPLARSWKYTGFVSSVAGTTITLSLPFWSDEEFDGANGHHYLEVLDGPQAGAWVDIVDTLGDAGAVITADDLSAQLLGREKVRIRPHHTFHSLFGSDNQRGLKGGNGRGNADEIIVFDAETQTATIVFYSTNRGAWVEAGAPSDPIDDFVIYPDQGLFIKRKSAGDRPIAFAGRIREEPVANRLLPGLNVLAGIPPKTGDRRTVDGQPPGLPRADAVRARSLTRDVEGRPIISDTGSLNWAQIAGLHPADRIHFVGGAGMLIEQSAQAPPETVMLDTATGEPVAGEGGEQ